VKKLLAQHFNLKKINVYSDLEGACIAASNYSPAIVGILGTGASCCRFNGKEVTEQAPSLGYLLGDEGSGASFGKRLVSAYLRKEMPARLKNLFEEGFDTHLLLQKIYLNKQPAAYLASFFPFIESYRKFDFINELIHDEINRFIDLHISPLKPKKTDSIHFCGSVAYLLQDEIKIHLKSRKLQSGQFIQHPAAALVKFLANQKS
jgi:N-acetylglucosamine kinase-like BadF-type ATPase